MDGLRDAMIGSMPLSAEAQVCLVGSSACQRHTQNSSPATIKEGM